MKRKVIIVAIVMWVASVLGGGSWGRFERYLRTRSIPAGQVEVNNLRNLYQAKLFDEALGECCLAAKDPRFTDYLPQILYIQWVTDCETGRIDDADRVQQIFLERFSNHELAADMHFNMAIKRLAAADYRGAETELIIIEDQFATGTVAPKALDMLERLRKEDADKAPSN